MPSPGTPTTRRPRARILVENPADGGVLYWIVRLYAFAAVGLVFGGVYLLAGLYIYFAAQLPPLPDLSSYVDRAPGVTNLYAADGSLIGELARERREVVPLDRVPDKLIEAFLSTEDRRFFTHVGIDYRGTVRALIANLRAGQVSQGGSTITQQVAKSYLTQTRSYSRKIREAILARRLEARYSKRAILALYLNQIFLGNGAYGVQAAARKYFDKDVDDLDVGEMAMIAGLARAPSRESPLVDMRAALARRKQVLANMVEVGTLTKDEAEHWAKQPLKINERRDYFHEAVPYFSEQVRRELGRKYGQKALYESGYRVETTVVPWLDVLAAENVDHAARKLDKRQGWRGPEARLGPELARIFRDRARAMYGDGPLEEDRLYLGLVEKTTAQEARVTVGGVEYPLPLKNMDWAHAYSARDATNDRRASSVSSALKKGDVVWVRWAHRSRVKRFTDFTYNAEGDAVWVPESEGRKPPAGPQQLALEQQPRVSGSLFTFDHHNGYVLAMAGGNDFDASEFNRVVQSCRQPGSAYKPIYYSLALDRGYSYHTEWNDKPKAEIDPVTGELWVPQNIDGTYSVRVSLERALVWSKNPPSVEIFELMGAKDVEQWARTLGFTTPIIADKALALGASCVRTDELSRAFAIFARSGRPVENVYIRRVIDHHGKVLEDHTAWDDGLLPLADRLDRIATVFGAEPEPVIAPRTAYLTSTLLRRIVTHGHSGPIRATKLPAAGKTGTSSHTSDVWFVGYTSRWLTSAWLGDDTYERQLGYKDASFMLSVPMWARFMYAAVGDMPLEEIPWEVPPGVKPNDSGGPLKAGFPPPPPPGFDVHGRPYELPARLQGALTAPPGGVLPDGTVAPPPLPDDPGLAPPAPARPPGGVAGRAAPGFPTPLQRAAIPAPRAPGTPTSPAPTRP